MSSVMRTRRLFLLLTLALLAVGICLMPITAQAVETKASTTSERDVAKSQSDKVASADKQIADKSESAMSVSIEKKQSAVDPTVQQKALDSQNAEADSASATKELKSDDSKALTSKSDSAVIKTASDSVVWSYSRNTMTITGSGIIEHFNMDYLSERNGINTLIIGEGITGIADKVFSWCNLIKTISLPSTLRSIGEKNFSDCWSLESINLPSGLTHLGRTNFKNCNKLKEITIPASLNSNAEAFYGSSIVSVFLEEGLTTIGNGMFSECEKLTSIAFPNSLVVIGDGAFSGCSALNQKLTFGPRLKAIGARAFYSCSGITGVTFNEGLESIGEDAFSFSWGTSANSSFTELSIPKTVKTIGSGAFEDQRYLKTITISGCTNMGEGTFQGCSALEKVLLGGAGIPVNVGIGAFANLTNLSSVAFKNVVSIGKNAFNGCTALKSINLEGVKTIGESAFSKCTSLSSVSLGTVLSEIGDMAFSGDSSLVSITLPRLLSKIGEKAFSSCGTVEFFGSATSGTYPIAGSSTRIIYPEGDKSWTKEARKRIAADHNNMFIRKANGSLVKAPYISAYQSVVVPFGSSKTEFLSSSDGRRSFDFTVPKKTKVRISMTYTLPCSHGTYYIHIVDSNGKPIWNDRTIKTTDELRERKTIYATKNLSAGEYHVEEWYVQTHDRKYGWFTVGVEEFLTGFVKKSGKTYYYNSNGVMQTGLKTISGNKYYLNAKTGVAAKGWKIISGKKYYFSTSTCAALKGWQKISKARYYFDSACVMQKSKWIGQYYVKANGQRDEGLTSGAWKKSGGRYWYKYKNGTYPKSCTRVISGKTYGFDSAGWMQTGWAKIKGKWYYFNDSGAMQKNKWIGGSYYVLSDGSMATNRWVDNNKYYFDKNGKWNPKKANPYRSETYSSNKAEQKAMKAVSLDFWYADKESTTGSSGLKAVEDNWNKSVFLCYGDWNLTYGNKETEGSVKYNKTVGSTYHYTFYTNMRKMWTAKLNAAKTLTMTEVANPKHIMVLSLRS